MWDEVEKQLKKNMHELATSVKYSFQAWRPTRLESRTKNTQITKHKLCRDHLNNEHIREWLYQIILTGKQEDTGLQAPFND